MAIPCGLFPANVPALSRVRPYGGSTSNWGDSQVRSVTGLAVSLLPVLVAGRRCHPGGMCTDCITIGLPKRLRVVAVGDPDEGRELYKLS